MSGFMIPVTSSGSFIRYAWNDEEHYVPADVEDTLPEDATVTGRYGGLWFARLSAPGYLDATDWQGPQPTEDAALYDLWMVYGNDETFTEFVEGKKHVVAGSLSIHGVRDELYGWNVEKIGEDIHLATLGDVEEGYDPNDDDLEMLQEAHDFVACGAIETHRLKKRFKEAEKTWRGE